MSALARRIGLDAKLTFVPIALWVATALAAYLAAFSPINVHPDERYHIEAAKYYADHWLPPAVGAPEARASYSQFGFSYLDELDSVYFFAGKFIAVAGWAISPSLAGRLFNVSLFAALAFLATRFHSVRPIFGLLLISPQIWYVFGYFNGDAFPLFLTFIATCLIVSPPYSRKAIVGLGVVLGLLAISKFNFSAFLIYVALLVVVGIRPIYSLLGMLGIGLMAYAQYFGKGLASALGASALACWSFLITVLVKNACNLPAKNSVHKLVFAGLVALTVLLPRVLYDLSVNGTPEHKSKIRADVARKLSLPEYLPDTAQSIVGIGLQRKKVRFQEIFFPPWNWGLVSFQSFVGLYGYMNVRSPAPYYSLMGLVYSFVTVYALIRIAASGSGEQRWLLLNAIFCCAFLIFFAAFASWTSDFQPQGRYLFPLIGVFALLGHRTSNLLKPALMQGALVIVFLLSAYSFIFVALTHLSYEVR